jgi:F-type H+-transporting ATPase subunit epsilon
MHCEIVSAEKELFSGEIKMLSARGTVGELGIMPGHAPLLTGIQAGTVILRLEDDSEEIFFASGGFLEIQPGFVTVLADVAARAEDIDEAQAEEARLAAEKEQSDAAAAQDSSMVAARLAEAVAQLRVLEELRRRKK